MRAILFICRFLAAIFCIIILQLFVVSALPSPLSLINMVFLSAIILLFLFEHGAVVWVVFSSLFCIELLGLTTPFGVVLFSGTVSMVCTFWLHTGIFTNRSWYSAGLLCFLSLVLYRGIYLLLLVISSLFAHTPLLWSQFFHSAGWELFVTSTTAAISIFVLSFFLSSLQTKALQGSLFRITQRN